MARSRNFRGRGISESQRRKKAWFALSFGTGASGATNVAFQTSIVMETAVTGPNPGETQNAIIAPIATGGSAVGDEFSLLPEECTILRMRGSLNFPKNVIDAPGVLQVVTDQYVIGYGVTDVRSIVTGSPPLPITDSDWDGWMFLRQSGISPVDSEGSVVDVKSMRKIQTGDSFFIAAQSVSGDSVATPIGQWTLDLRLLILLP